MYETTFQNNISPNDGLPQKICSDCFTKFCSIDAFRVACQEAKLKRAEEHQELETSKATTTVSAKTQPNTASDPIEIFVDAVDIDEAEEEEEQQ
uniref:GG16939 n=1 Tax=Drosophila erecta TaxID=7220 RepID=B3NZP1_DROER